MLAYIVLAAALLLIFLEFYLPGGIMATGGVLLILVSMGMIYTYSESGIEVFLFFVLAIVGVVAVIKAALWSIKRTGTSDTIFLESDQEGFRASSFDKDAFGKKGKAVCDLHPGGYILIDKKKYSAISMAGFIEKGKEIIVIGGEGETLHVKLNT